jgi:hypothetical protein
VLKGFASIVPPDADVEGSRTPSSKVVDTPFGKRPFRVHIDPTQDGAEVVNAWFRTVSAPSFFVGLGWALLQEPCSRNRVVELEGPHRVTPNEIASTFTKVLGQPVRMQVVPRDSWEALFRSQGMKNPLPRMRMLDGFNEGWIEFENRESASQNGSTSLESVLKSLAGSVL